MQVRLRLRAKTRRRTVGPRPLRAAAPGAAVTPAAHRLQKNPLKKEIRLVLHDEIMRLPAS